MSELTSNQLELLRLAEGLGALKFSPISEGGFRLKSGRISPYFFNAGNLGTGEALELIGRCYADAVAGLALDSFSVVFGPAYKGISLAAMAAVGIWNVHHRSIPVVYNRKETKDHGEGGDLVGSVSLERVLIVDDVITAGTAVREASEIIVRHGGTLAGLVLLLDRQEKGTDTELSAVQQVKQQHGIPVLSVLTFTHLMAYVEGNASFAPELFKDMQAYREMYGVG